MHSKKEHKAQAALEYLITYGWALIAIATVVGVLIFAAGGGVNSNTCTTFLSLVCKGIGVDGDTLVMVLQNATGQTISINPFSDICFDGKCGYAAIEYGDTTYRFDTVEIPAGAEFKVFGYGQVLASEMSITYTEETTGLTKTVTSGVGTEAPNDIELSNDGEDSDGGGSPDCLDALNGFTTCTYMLKTQTLIPTITKDSTVSYTFNLNQISDELASQSTSLDTKLLAVAIYVESQLSTTATIEYTIGGISDSNPPTVTLSKGWNIISPSDFGTTNQAFDTITIKITPHDADLEIAIDEEKRPYLVVDVELGGGGGF